MHTNAVIASIVHTLSSIKPVPSLALRTASQYLTEIVLVTKGLAYLVQTGLYILVTFVNFELLNVDLLDALEENSLGGKNRGKKVFDEMICSALL